MSRKPQPLLTLLLAFSLLAALSVGAAPSPDAPPAWWVPVTRTLHKITALLSTGGGAERGPDFDPDGDALNNTRDDGGNMGPDFDPDGLTVGVPGGHIGPDFDPDGAATTTKGDDNRGPDFDPNG